MPHHHELIMSGQTASPAQIKISWLIGTLAAFAVFAAIGGYSARMTRDYSDYDQDRAAQRVITLAKVRAAEGKLLNPVDAKGNPSAEWVDQDAGTVRIPIEEAMVAEVDTLKAKPVASGTVIPGSAPAAPIPPATNAPAATAPKSSAPASAAPPKHAKRKKANT
jgi:hypothetical protein